QPVRKRHRAGPRAGIRTRHPRPQPALPRLIAVSRPVDDDGGASTVGEDGGARPRIAVSYVRAAPSHPAWFSKVLADLAQRAAAGLSAAGAEPIVLNSASGHVFSALDYDGVVILGGGDVDPARYAGDIDEPTVHCVD